MTKISIAKELARLVRASQEIREASWTGTKYLIGNEQAARDAVCQDLETDPEDYEALVQLIEMLNEALWSDVFEWAEAVLGQE